VVIIFLCCVHLCHRGGPRRHRADRLPPHVTHPSGRNGPRRHRVDQLPPCATHPTGRDGPHRYQGCLYARPLGLPVRPPHLLDKEISSIFEYI
jgi:hypothetical protein